MSRNRLVAYVLGAVYLLVGLAGFLLNSDFADTDTDDKVLGLFEINGLHNVVHLVIGIALLAAASKGYRAARSANLAVGATYLLVGILGLFISGENNDANILSLNAADNALHLGTVLVLLAVALAEKEHVEVDRERDRTSIA